MFTALRFSLLPLLILPAALLDPPPPIVAGLIGPILPGEKAAGAITTLLGIAVADRGAFLILRQEIRRPDPRPQRLVASAPNLTARSGVSAST